MTQTNEKKMMVTAYCNPYHARFHHYQQRVLKYDGTTPVKWVMDDDYGCGISRDKALCILERYASEDGFEYFDEQSLEAWVEDFKEAYEYENEEPYEGDVDTSWYEGRGYYDSESLTCMYLCGQDYYRHDTMSYSIEEFIPEEKEVE